MKKAVVALALLAGCDACGKKTAPPPPIPVEASTPKKALAGKDGSRSLIAWTDARVAVSSTVDNPRDLPEHLIDRKVDTAWNGRTGDLVGGWMAFRVPQAARVRQIRVTCGFDKKDLFTQNQRIKKLHLTRNGEPLRDVELDVENRRPQTIDVDADGGDFVMTVTEVVPGTKKEWRELVVSELDVVGVPGAALRASPHTPRVRVGSLDAPEPGPEAGTDTVPVGPYPSLDAFCKRWHEAWDPAMAAVRADQRFPCEGLRAECTHMPAPSPAVGDPIRGGALVTTSGTSTKLALALETQQGWYVDALVLDDSERCVLGDPGMTEASLVSLSPSLEPGKPTRATIDQKSSGPMFQRELDDGGTEPAMWIAASAERSRWECRMNNDVPKCRKSETLLEWHGEGDVPDASKWSKR